MGPEREQLLDLLTLAATEGLEPAAGRELEHLKHKFPDEDGETLELAAGAAHLAFLGLDVRPLEPMPRALRQQIETVAQTHLPDTGARAPEQTAGVPARQPSTWFQKAGWYAAAASLLIAVYLAGPAREPAAPDLAEQRQTLLRQAPDAIEVAWAQSEQPGYEGVRGDVVWSNARQTGFMRLVGLPANVPAEAQYQLWIVDPERDERPVDGGVFDMPRGPGEHIIPIDAKLRILQPAAFAITLERPGGVVVSAGPLLVVAAVEG